MFRLLAIGCAMIFCNTALAKKITVKNIEELKTANANAGPGDTVVLKNGDWNNVIFKLNCSGTAEKPIVFKAETPGKVRITGVSQLKLGGNFIIVDGLLFTSGYSPSSAVIDYRISKDELANHCRVTNTVINDFNKPKRMSEDYWVSFSGKNNRLDHCSFYNKKNLGVLLAVILDDDRSRENFHSIDHNYFGIRPPLGSNGGEIIRVGVSEHCQFNSNTQIRDNFFEYCDGETEIVSIKSCSNVVSNNVFKECQGSVVLRHGNYNTVTNNIFLGYNKEATGGVRIINRGQWVINNFFYQVRGESFKAPIAIMNGIPNSPANRYVQVTDAVVMNNTFVDCTPVSFAEGSDAERSLPPSNVLFAKNIFYNSKDTAYFKAWDDISGIRFSENKVSRDYEQPLKDGFQTASFGTTKIDNIVVPTAGRGINRIGIDSLTSLDKKRMPVITPAPGFSGLEMVKSVEGSARNSTGAKWFVLPKGATKSIVKNCKTADEIYTAISETKEPLKINLTGTSYSFDKPLVINSNIEITSSKKNLVELRSSQTLEYLFLIRGKGSLLLNNLNFSAKSMTTGAFAGTDTVASSEHFNFKMTNVTAKNLSNCLILFSAAKSTFADSVVIENCQFSDLYNGIFLAYETDNKGYYNAEKIRVSNNRFSDGLGCLINIYRGGNDESTLGPNLVFSNNQVSKFNLIATNLNYKEYPLISLTGVQKSRITGNQFDNCLQNGKLIEYEDTVRARHFLAKNTLIQSGRINKDQFVEDHGNSIR